MLYNETPFPQKGGDNNVVNVDGKIDMIQK